MTDRATRVTVLPTLPQDGVASMNRFARELVAEMRKRERFDTRLAPHPLALGDGGHRLRARGGRTIARFVRYPMVVRKLDSDLFHIADQGYAHLAAAVPKERTVVTCHDLMPLQAAAVGAPFRAPRVTVARYRLSVSFLRRVAHVACDSEVTRRDVVRILGVDPARTSVIPIGVNRRFKPLGHDVRERLRCDFPGNPRLLLHVSSGFPYKNVEGTLEVLSHLRRAGAPALLLRVGVPLTPAQWDLAARLGVADAVHDQGRVDDERLIELYNLVDAMIFPSHWEGFGWPALEALACGAPVVVSNCAPLLESTGGAALSADARDSKGLAAAVLRLWSSADLTETLRTRGLGQARSHSWDEVTRRYSELYAAVAGR